MRMNKKLCTYELFEIKWNHLTVRKETRACLKMLLTKCVKKPYFTNFNKMICHLMTYNGWYAIKPNQSKPNKTFDVRLCTESVATRKD